MMKRLLPMFIAIGLLILIVAGYMGVQVIERYTPSDEWMEASDFFGVEEDSVALILNEEQSDTVGLYLNETTYLPLEWVNENLNKRFYWDSEEKILSYALPNEVRYADCATMGEDGNPLLWVTDEKVYVSLNMVAAYTDVALGAFDSGETKRLFINNTWTGENWSEVRKDSMIREKGGIKSPIITQAAR